MSQSEIFIESQKAFEHALAFRQLFKILPLGCELSVVLEDRVECALYFTDPEVKLEARVAKDADFQFVVFPESIRRLSEKSPDELLPLAQELTSLFLAGHLRIKLLTSVQTLYKKGYVETLKGLGPEVQKELSKLSFVLLAQASQAVETIKNILKR